MPRSAPAIRTHRRTRRSPGQRVACWSRPCPHAGGDRQHRVCGLHRRPAACRPRTPVASPTAKRSAPAPPPPSSTCARSMARRRRTCPIRSPRARASTSRPAAAAGAGAVSAVRQLGQGRSRSRSPAPSSSIPVPTAFFNIKGKAYAPDYNEVKTVGSAAVRNAAPDSEESRIARFWPGGGANLNGFTRGIVASRGLDLWQNARLFALMNIAVSDGLIVTFETKYTLQLLAPIHRDPLGQTTAIPRPRRIRPGPRTSPRRRIPTTPAACRTRSVRPPR